MQIQYSEWIGTEQFFSASELEYLISDMESWIPFAF